LKKIFLFLGAALFVTAAIVCALIFSVRTGKVTDYAMNTVISVTLRSRNPEKDAKAAIDEVKRIDALMSATRAKSDISKINSSKAGKKIKISPEVSSLIELSLYISEKTGGAFDITINPVSELWDITSLKPSVPHDVRIREALSKVNYKDIDLDAKNNTVMLKKEGMSINLGAIAKGYAADRVAKLLKDRGVSEAIVDLGGNVYVIGREKTVGIQTPFKTRGEYFTTCTVSDKSVVTSGAYERYFKENDRIYHHILNPSDGYPASSGIQSATVISESSALADGLTTAFYVMGEEKTKAIISEFKDIEVILLTDKGDVVRIYN